MSWPQDAASWLRPARRIVAGESDAWVIADTPAGFAQLARRLAHQKRWSPPQTFGFASLASTDLIALSGTLLSGMTGATSTGGFWFIRHQTLIIDDEPDEVGR